MNERVSNIIHHQAFVPVLTGLSAFVAGAGLGYWYGRREKQYQIVQNNMNISDAFEEAKEAYTRHQENREEHLVEEEESSELPPRVVIDADRIEKADNFLKDILTPKDEPPEEVEPEIHNIFAGDDDDWSYEEEKKHRTTTAPYVLHKDEFYGEENADKGYTQSTLTYYAGDDILVDEDDKPIYNHSQIIGELKFGHGSGDPNVFYVRNDERNGEYEIIVDSGLYSVEVLGLEIENNARVQDLKHSNSPRRFRPD